ncbi:hypothetical protein [Prevotella falsenii]|uniref:hypothetical protein n=1 Tax=Prevotella falsenii TaxID=515414 RepID=UPI0005680B22|nr:hypothetical protein [Prevotella falsenii]
MMNKYITALLVVLAATGVEAQTYQSALKAAMGNSTLEEFCNHLELKGVETDILSIIEAYKNISKEEENKPAATRLALFERRKAVLNVGKLGKPRKTISSYLPNPSVNSAILIRAPSRFIS